MVKFIWVFWPISVFTGNAPRYYQVSSYAKFSAVFWNSNPFCVISINLAKILLVWVWYLFELLRLFYRLQYIENMILIIQ